MKSLFFALFCILISTAQALDFRILDYKAQLERPFIQGYEIKAKHLYISSGRYQHSYIARIDLNNESLAAKTNFPNEIFAEGLTEMNGLLYVLSWKNGILSVFDAETLEQKHTLYYEGEGWGLSHNKQYFIMSDGSDTLQLRNLHNFALIEKVAVHYQQKPLQKINELEWAEDYLWANVWHEAAIYQIDLKNGEAVARYDFSNLEKKHRHSEEAVLNGIAYDADKKAFWISGKLWDRRYLVQFARKRLAATAAGQ